MPLPLIKLGSLFIKTLSKPLANAIKRNVKTHPHLSNTIAIPAQGNILYVTARTLNKNDSAAQACFVFLIVFAYSVSIFTLCMFTEHI